MKAANQTAKGADVVESETKIVNLADAPEFLEEVSRWLWLEWAKADGYTLEEIIYRTKYASQKDTVPQTLVAVRDGKPVGVVSLWLNDLKTRQDLSPWMATLYVKDEYRNLHIGQQLQKASIEAVRALNRYPCLYLITKLDNYYEKLGWQFVEKAPEGGGVMEKIYRYDF